MGSESVRPRTAWASDRDATRIRTSVLLDVRDVVKHFPVKGRNLRGGVRPGCTQSTG